ncbi:anaerobic glycerol-3-phosphate dehydrogenase subunit B [Halalkalicoccus paucihalophilus]|uniref:Anaerobic glycerol-3-phosphate dehydrogenase subunit B n=1 Tax=Halalkalicoccus paucihalophilus TaxID=1008153 RepID=A0A151AD54_9EURY|nr:glycerol-3-phosphate dehydrogenase subunit GlpB [Halalkalicoccus paucihalophilus]KYH25534.1 anaerobic glycerol-3-phosphate dehydrogenase subunit B [Halalkalicoccus paucihalophilus]
MAIESDVLVIGGGLAGASAAIEAARGGASARLVTHKENTLRNASGLIDVLGYHGSDEPIVEPFEAIPDLPDHHPYRKVGVDAVRESLALFDEITEGLYEGGHTETNALSPTYGGRVKPTSRYPKSAAAGLASRAEDTLLVGFETVTTFDAPLSAERLDSSVPFEVRGVTIPFPGEFRADARITRLARALDADELLDRENRTGTREALAERVSEHLGDAKRIGFPAILGDEEHREVRETLEDELGVPVFEVPMGPPSLPGMRLEDRLYEALETEGVRVESGNPVVGYTADEGRITAVSVDRGRREIPYHADQFVLATGGLVGKGIDSTREGVFEPVFDCHVPQPEERYEWFHDEAFDDQPYARFGVAVDDDLRPLDPEGDPEFSNLRAAGAVLGGYDMAREKSASGVSLSTGQVAGRNANEDLQ